MSDDGDNRDLTVDRDDTGKFVDGNHAAKSKRLKLSNYINLHFPPHKLFRELQALYEDIETPVAIKKDILFRCLEYQFGKPTQYNINENINVDLPKVIIIQPGDGVKDQ